MKSLFHKLTLAAFVSLSISAMCGMASAQTLRTWVNQSPDRPNEWTGYYKATAGGSGGNWSPIGPNDPNPPYTFAGSALGFGITGSGSLNDVAFFGSTAATAVGIDFQSTVSSGSGGLTLAGIGYGSNFAYSLGNSSQVTDGFLQLNGAAMNNATGQLAGGTGTKLIVVSDNQTQNVTIQKNYGTGNKNMTLRLGTANGEFYVANGRQLAIDIAVEQAASNYGFTKTGAGTMVLSQNNTFAGGVTISGGTVQIGNGGGTGDLGSNTTVNNNGTLAFNRNNQHIYSSTVNGTGSLVKHNSNQLILTANHGFTGGVTINGGNLQLGNGSNTGSLAAGGGISIAAGATLTVNRSDNVTLGAVTGGRTITAAGNFRQAGAGALQLDAALSVSGSTNVDSGSLVLNNTTLSSTGGVIVAAGATLGGSGTINGNVNMTAGGTLTPGTSPGTLSINGNLLLGSASVLNFELNENNLAVGGGINDLVAITGNLTLDGTLNVTGIPSNVFANVQKTWTLFTYSGVLTNNGLLLGSLPSGPMGWVIDTSNAGKVNLTAVPEPSSALVFTGLFAGAALLRRRRSV